MELDDFYKRVICINGNPKDTHNKQDNVITNSEADPEGVQGLLEPPSPPLF